ncbi:patatin-like phospholipase family protein [Vitiosangium sp. GDMCC 1.1324]|uniref:patatin-like phospholipase family protein n=1 Tax=Vitiosangium sp. (strain GDMCC 1.1324) TaxID=2138576 RepID=UPI00130E1D96|nr:patatin-like phospholipase family protein [Vitiosangium sp. GDMCC 1.1324]
MKREHTPSYENRDDPRIILVLQGGGSLGAYHLGVYEALAEKSLHPHWVSGISIGAFTAAVLAGNRPERRVERLKEFWREISWPGDWGSSLPVQWRKVANMASHATSLLFGQPNFFAPRWVSPLLSTSGSADELSFYTTHPMRSTLRRLVDFEYINSHATRLSLGAARLRDGELVFFDNARDQIGPEHVLASGSLPPAFPPTRINGELYWDGGCVSNTPLNAILEDPPDRHTLIFMIDLFDKSGPEPRSMDDVNWRAKSIQYASRTSHHIAQMAREHNMSQRLERERGGAHFSGGARPPRRDIVHLVYKRGADQTGDSDAEFSRWSIEERRQAGYRDMKRVLELAPWKRAPSNDMAPASFSSSGEQAQESDMLVHTADSESQEITSHLHL